MPEAVRGPLGALRALESVLLRGRVHGTARRNAFAAVCADRERAAARRDAERALAALGAPRGEPRSEPG